uniref:restriction endonuclease n=1 Tax=Algoriphagus sp. TaxID=1872435 RepID=UPI00404791B9
MYAQIKETLNEGLHNRYEIFFRYDEILDIVSKFLFSFSGELETSFHNKSVDNYFRIQESKFEFPVVEFSHYIHGVTPPRDPDDACYKYHLIEFKSLEELSAKIELNILESLLNWNKDFIDYILLNLSPNLNDSINFQELNNYYLNNSLTIDEYLPEDLNWLSISTKSRLKLLNELKSYLTKLNAYKFLPENFEEGNFIDKAPEKSFFKKIFGVYEAELLEFENKKKAFIIDQKAKKELELNRVINYKKILSKFISPCLEKIENEIKLNESIYQKNNEIVHFDYLSKFKSIIDNNTINLFFNFEYDLLLKEDFLVLELYMPSFDKYMSSNERFKSKKNSIELEYRRICISIFFGLADLIWRNDNEQLVNHIFINGLVSFRDKTNGKLNQGCVMSLNIPKMEFVEFDLNYIDLNVAFKKLKGISASHISEFIPIRPILSINKFDKRFVEGRDVLNVVDEDTNLASMDWEDFEHFIRDLFQKEFSSIDGEVKITQSSRDGGIDAVAFDPDPIKGGKIVIQSKRYTKVVGVSAVRDLYGTMINEGANKGILVTTSHFGSDAYQFAKGKPLTLIDGPNLLQLLRKHNFKAKIDIEEAIAKRKNNE